MPFDPPGARFKPQQCVVCAKAVARNPDPVQGSGDPYPTCEAVACRMVISRRAEMGEAGFKHHLALHIRHREYHLVRTQQERERRHANDQENRVAWNALRARLPAALASEPLRITLPTGPRRASRVTDARRDKYRQHLHCIIAEARTTPPPLPPPDLVAAIQAPAPAMAGHLCTMCGGGCCTRGGEKAYLSAVTMRRFMNLHPDLSDDEVIGAYLAHVPAASQTGSCINHTAHGCSLPRALRSDPCNNYLCHSLKAVQVAQAGPDGVHTILIVRRKQENWRQDDPRQDNGINGYGLLREKGMRRFSRAALLPDASPRAPEP